MAVWGPRLEDALDLRVNVCEPPKFVAKLAAPGMQSTRGELFLRPVDSWGRNSVILARADPQKVAQLDTVGIFRSGVTQTVCVHLGSVSLHVGCALSAEWDTNNAGAGPRWREDTCFEPGSQTAALGPKSIGSILTAEVQKSEVLTKVSTFMKLCEAWVDCRSYGACC